MVTTEEVSGWIAVYKDVASLGFPAALVIAFVTGFYRVWIWGKTHQEIVKVVVDGYEIRIAEWKEQCRKQEVKVDTLQDKLDRATGLLETTVIKRR